ncbi:hypothetical protein GGD81_004197 [Rhodobium orientis]|uniref:Uncharacterized protein n=1 Tax=Rhodobium orientis TaxID=34017 RepID=A0A327JLQ8_9HYPH|nr:hypothetical protein [Rhodobium orientis]MBB4305129.1 hypothetical protein [Rhodobium orientis]MBK5950904.1 hypothetical protein [Rhodobium orientis]RAI27021.1 hypothetical protein CH339_11805 [Rhodobium orientis]
MSTFSLGYKIRRAELCYTDDLMVQELDLDWFCIPVDLADNLALAYKRYLAACGLFNEVLPDSRDDIRARSDRDHIEFLHERDGISFKIGRFELGPALKFLHLETGFPHDVCARWCMMMEFIIWQDEESKRKKRLEWEAETEDADA